tara:strand:+ start:263 stop:394 length:132 start_codon:yes stop_codon:yes gene_type:complete
MIAEGQLRADVVAVAIEGVGAAGESLPPQPLAKSTRKKEKRRR